MARTKQTSNSRRTPRVSTSDPSVQPDVFCAGVTQGKARAICTWRDELLFVSCGGVSPWGGVLVFDPQSGAFLRKLHPPEYLTMDLLAVLGDTLYAAYTIQLESERGKDGGVVCFALPSLEACGTFKNLRRHPEDTSIFLTVDSILGYDNERLFGASDNGGWCIWDRATAAVVRLGISGRDTVRGASGVFFGRESMAGVGRWHFFSWCFALDVETGLEYAQTTFNEHLEATHGLKVQDECLHVADGGRESRCRVFVPFLARAGRAGARWGVLELAVDFPEFQPSTSACGLSQVEPSYALARRIDVPDASAGADTGPSGITLRGDLLYVNCSSSAFVARLVDGGAETVWWANHFECDINEMYDGGPVHADSSGACYVSSDTIDTPYPVEQEGRSSRGSVCCIKRFKLR